MKVYNPFKKIKQLEEMITDKEKEAAELKETIARMTGKIEHETGFWCTGCKNSVKGGEGLIAHTYCKLDMRCEDREM